MKKSSAIKAEGVAVRQNGIAKEKFDRKVLKLAEPNEEYDVYVITTDNHDGMREASEEFETRIDAPDIIVLDVDIYNKHDLKVAMLNIAGHEMNAYFGDIVYDFEEIESLFSASDILYWYIRETGTGMRRNDYARFCQDMQDWGEDKVKRMFRILSPEYDWFILAPYNGI